EHAGELVDIAGGGLAQSGADLIQGALDGVPEEGARERLKKGARDPQGQQLADIKGERGSGGVCFGNPAFAAVGLLAFRETEAGAAEDVQITCDGLLRNAVLVGQLFE